MQLHILDITLHLIVNEIAQQFVNVYLLYVSQKVVMRHVQSSKVARRLSNLNTLRM